MPEKKQKILIVDDTPTNIQILDEVLKDEYEIYFAVNGAVRLLFPKIAHRAYPPGFSNAAIDTPSPPLSRVSTMTRADVFAYMRKATS